MNTFEKNIISIIKAGLNGKDIRLEGLDYEKIYLFSKAHQLECLIYGALFKDENFKKSNVYNKFTTRVYALTKKSVNQYFELERVYSVFNQNNIDYMPLKGAVLSGYYSKKELREMSDADILIRLEQYDKIEEVLKNNGFINKYQSNHEIVWKNELLTIELHKLLIPSYNIDFDRYYGDSWSFAKIKNGNLYQMNKEDLFVYAFTHFAKHYRDGGAGLKYVIDFYLLLNKEKFDFLYIETELKKLRLTEFYHNIKDLIDVWFNDGTETEKTDFLTYRIFKSGVYGDENRDISGGVRLSKTRKSVRLISLFRLFFPNASSMKERYPFLKKHVIFLPVFWIYRLFTKLFSFKKSNRTFKAVKKWNNKNIVKYNEELKYVGLDYYFDEGGSKNGN